MAKYLVGEVDDHEAIEARGIAAAVEQHVEAHVGDGWSDRFSVYARAESDDRWTVFSVTTRTEFIVTVGNGKPGPMVESDDSEAAQ